MVCVCVVVLMVVVSMAVMMAVLMVPMVWVVRSGEGKSGGGPKARSSVCVFTDDCVRASVLCVRARGLRAERPTHPVCCAMAA